MNPLGDFTFAGQSDLIKSEDFKLSVPSVRSWENVLKEQEKLDKLALEQQRSQLRTSNTKSKNRSSKSSDATTEKAQQEKQKSFWSNAWPKK